MADHNNDPDNNIKKLIDVRSKIFSSGEIDDNSEVLVNSISGTDFYSTVEKAGVNKMFVQSLNDMLTYTINVQSFYVPDVKIFSPLFIYNSYDIADKLQQKMIDKEQYNEEDLKDLNHRISPVIGEYKITELSYNIDSNGL